MVSDSEHEAGACIQDQSEVISFADTTQVSLTLPVYLLHSLARL